MAFRFQLENQDGTPADPPTLHTAVPNWAPGDTIPLGPARGLGTLWGSAHKRPIGRTDCGGHAGSRIADEADVGKPV